ncbi:tyrosine-type recombinase/integrase [Conexibacter sp. CPCC 206217]|uniref:tyrosine-type recombinase/integrase n=1 Tax=Conexibacter sp. CPCC 206217 TaxID=3064574 RepID=UPI00271F6A94|nr:tyrosine-type recombinase/integrase [Conexibacter sp. CPCC 206217]MDO8213902.1 tyrosine-type recombinase/integrase [Conexibacter sp. CPCC 206217]
MVRERTVARNVIERFFDESVFVLRFTAYHERQYVTLGTRQEGWDDKRAIEERDNIMADVRRGIWVPPDRNKGKQDKRRQEIAAGPVTVPTFSAFARRRLAGRDGEVGKRTIEHDEWALTLHLEPFFAHTPLDKIDTEMVDDYRRHKVAQSRQRAEAIKRGKPLRNHRGDVLRPLAATTINTTIDELQAILALAGEYRHISENPAEGRRRRLTEPPRRPVHLDTADAIRAMLDAAEFLDRTPRYRATDRHAIVATLIFGGERATELCELRWRDIDLVLRRTETGSKTQAGMREIDHLPILQQALARHKAASRHTQPDDLVFATNTGGMRDKDNLRNRILALVIELADALLIERGQRPLPKGVTPHKLRHTFASILVACGVDPATVMYLLGHTDPKFTLRVYTHMMNRSPQERARLRALVYCEPLDDQDAPPDALAA